MIYELPFMCTLNHMEVFVEIEAGYLPIKQEIVESVEVFAQRLGFFLYALDLGFSVEKSKILANCYVNKLLYDCVYSDLLEEEIAKVTDACPA